MARRQLSPQLHGISVNRHRAACERLGELLARVIECVASLERTVCVQDGCDAGRADPFEVGGQFTLGAFKSSSELLERLLRRRGLEKLSVRPLGARHHMATGCAAHETGQQRRSVARARRSRTSGTSLHREPLVLADQRRMGARFDACPNAQFAEIDTVAEQRAGSRLGQADLAADLADLAARRPAIS